VRINSNYAAAFRARSGAYIHKGEYFRAIADHGRFFWLRFGILGIAIRLCIFAFLIAVAFRFNFKRLRKDPMTAN
jgi:hypothetical protein